ncbi:MAG: D-alanyl-D-alanine carboxypeptidase family protein [Lachnospiraceae bacterium]|nr:D-alanyl-D-alanine carboxypeptidase family protein [Lachnospiraceae bacterium]
MIHMQMPPIMQVYAETVEEEQEQNEDEIGLSLLAESAVLMEASTGKILYEKNAKEAKPPASVTKVMTLLLIFEALEDGKLKLADEIAVSSHAASMGGSQVFLEAGEVQTAETMIKCIAVASANDACVAMAEHLCGSEEAFVAKMNERAKELKMENTSFVNCCGLDAQGHETSAKDIALMSRELTVKHPDIFRYTTIWMDEFTHKTQKGESVFGLSNTNKLLKNYEGCNGLKTGSTGEAKFCLSATASRNQISLIAVVMACPDSKIRMKDAASLFDYGFANVTMYEDVNPGEGIGRIIVKGGREKEVKYSIPDSFSYVLTKEEDASKIKKEKKILDNLNAPIKKGEVIGEIEYSIDGKMIGAVPIKAAHAVKKLTLPYAYKIMWKTLLFGKTQ